MCVCVYIYIVIYIYISWVFSFILLFQKKFLATSSPAISVSLSNSPKQNLHVKMTTSIIIFFSYPLLTNKQTLTEPYMLPGFWKKKKKRLIEVSKELEEHLHGVEKSRRTFGKTILRLKCQCGDFGRKLNLWHRFLFSLIILPELSPIYWQVASFKNILSQCHILSATLRLVRATCLGPMLWVIWGDESCT